MTLTRDEREAVAQILALPDGPWEFSPGHPTAASFFESAREADRYVDECRRWIPVIGHYDPRPPRRKPALPGHA